MPKTYSLQVEKAQTLVAGLRKNYDLIKGHGITHEEINQLEKETNAARDFNSELDALRNDVNIKTSEANKKLTEMRERMQNMKQIIKKSFDQSNWERLGIMDKR